MSQQIRKLEDELGHRLFDRMKREAKLTTHGEAFLPRAMTAVISGPASVSRAHSWRRFKLYQTLSLLGGAGCTAIPQTEDDALKATWEKHPLWPATMEQATSISGGDDEKNAYDKFCPEVAYDTFGLSSAATECAPRNSLWSSACSESGIQQQHQIGKSASPETM